MSLESFVALRRVKIDLTKQCVHYSQVNICLRKLSFSEQDTWRAGEQSD